MQIHAYCACHPDVGWPCHLQADFTAMLLVPMDAFFHFLQAFASVAFADSQSFLTCESLRWLLSLTTVFMGDAKKGQAGPRL